MLAGNQRRNCQLSSPLYHKPMTWWRTGHNGSLLHQHEKCRGNWYYVLRLYCTCPVTDRSILGYRLNPWGATPDHARGIRAKLSSVHGSTAGQLPWWAEPPSRCTRRRLTPLLQNTLWQEKHLKPVVPSARRTFSPYLHTGLSGLPRTGATAGLQGNL
jgi:hypothetical protein